MSEFMRSLPSSPWLARMRLALEVGLVIAIGLIGARLIWLMVAPAGTVSQSAPLPRYSDSATAYRVQSADLSVLENTNPFVGAHLALSSDVPDAPETALNLRLVGSRAQTRSDGGAAIIVTPDNQEAVFAPGDEIMNGVMLERVLNDQILLRRMGVLESLRREGRDEGLVVLSDEGEEIIPKEADDGPPDQTETTTDPINGEALLNSIRLEQKLENGNVSAYLLTPRDNGDLMQAAGLKPGDVLIGIDGVSISEMANNDLAKTFETADMIRLQVRRDGEILDLALALRR